MTKRQLGFVRMHEPCDNPLCIVCGDPRDTNVIPTLKPGLQEEYEARDERERNIFAAGFLSCFGVIGLLWLLIRLVG
jgi:hypothetical protein